MKLSANVKVEEGALGVDPIAVPGEVPDRQIMRFSERANISDRQCRRLLFTMDAPVGETVTVDLFALDEGTIPNRIEGRQLTDALKAKRRFHRFHTGLIITSGEVAVSQEPAGPPGGPVYMRVTAETIAASQAREIRGACADS